MKKKQVNLERFCSQCVFFGFFQTIPISEGELYSENLQRWPWLDLDVKWSEIIWSVHI